MFAFFFKEKKGAVANQLKKVGEVKVSSPEDRKSGEIEMHQRTSRYCMNPSGRSLDCKTSSSSSASCESYWSEHSL